MARSAGAKNEDPEARIGAQIRMLREKRGLSLRGVSTACGITAGALSLIERGANTPCLSTLRKILAVLGSSMSEFFAAVERPVDDGGGIVFRADQLVTAASGRGIRFLGLPGSPSSRSMQLLYETYSPRYGDSGDAPYSHVGEEGGFCISGTIEMTVGGRREILGPGDAYYYSSKLPHRWRNVGKVPAIVVSACTPPSLPEGRV